MSSYPKTTENSGVCHVYLIPDTCPYDRSPPHGVVPMIPKCPAFWTQPISGLWPAFLSSQLCLHHHPLRWKQTRWAHQCRIPITQVTDSPPSCILSAFGSPWTFRLLCHKTKASYGFPGETGDCSSTIYCSFSFYFLCIALLTMYDRPICANCNFRWE